MPSVHIQTNQSVAGVDFGSPEAVILEQVVTSTTAGVNRRVNANGEVELLIDGAIYRLQQNCFVEATFPDHATSSTAKAGNTRYSAYIDGVAVLSVFDWLVGQSDMVDIARFRVSEQVGIAYDYRNPQTGSYTVFAPGHWAGLIR